jgi:hypothetical protein
MTKAAAVMVCGGEKKLLLRFLNFDVWRGGRLSGWPFCSRRIPRVRFLSEQSHFSKSHTEVEGILKLLLLLVTSNKNYS